MKLSQLIAAAQEAMRRHGDIEVAIRDTEYEWHLPAVVLSVRHQLADNVREDVRDAANLGAVFFVVDDRLPVDEDRTDPRFPVLRKGPSEVLLSTESNKGG